MKKYLVSYDLIKQKDYPKLWTELERLGAKRVLLSVWCMNVNANSATDLRERGGGSGTAGIGSN